MGIFGFVEKLLGPAERIIDELHTSPEEKAAAKVKFAELARAREAEIEATLRSEIAAKERILVAELQQSDDYTRRARPSVVYFGLLLTFVNYVLVPWVARFSGVESQPIEIPSQFWLAWGGIVGTWVIGRTAEKRGTANAAVKLITGGTT